MRTSLTLGVVCSVAACAHAEVVYLTSHRLVSAEVHLDIFDGHDFETRTEETGALGRFDSLVDVNADPFPTFFIHALCAMESNIGPRGIQATASTALHYFVSSGLANGSEERFIILDVTFQVLKAQPYTLVAMNDLAEYVSLMGPGMSFFLGQGTRSIQGILAPGQYQLQAVFGSGRDFDSTSGGGGSTTLVDRWSVNLAFIPAPASLALGVLALASSRRRGR